MPTMQEVRDKFPQYNDMTDEQLATALHRKFYADMPFDQFAEKVGLAKPQTVADGKTDRERSWGETALDVAASGAQGLSSGVQSLLGTVGDAQQVSGDVLAWGADKLGFSPDTQNIARNVGKLIPTLGLPIPAPTTEQINKVVNPLLPQYSPQTDAGRYAKTIGEFAPAAAAGPGGVVRKTAMAVIPGIATTLAGDMTDQNPYAKAGAGIVAGFLTAGRGNAGTRRAIRNAPTAEAIAQTTDDTYNTLRNAGIAYDNNAFAAFVQQLQRQMHQRGYRPRVNSPHPVAADIEELAAAANNPLDFSEMESLRRSIGLNLPANASNQDRAAANFVREQLDNFMENAPFVSNGNVPANEVHALTRQARELASRNIKNRTLEEAIGNARLAASGFENGLRIEMRKILKNPNRRRGFTQAELNAMMTIAGGTTPQNLLAQFGRLGISLDRMTSKASLLPTIIAGGGYSAGATLPAAGLVGAATAAKYGSRLMAERSARDLTALTRVGRADQEAAMGIDDAVRQRARARAALTADSAIRQNTPEWFIQDANGNTYPMPSSALSGVPR